jgi:cytochrome c-type biogenesis protein CcmH
LTKPPKEFSLAMRKKRTGCGFSLALALIAFFMIGGTIYGRAWEASDPTAQIGWGTREAAGRDVADAAPTPTPDPDEVDEVSKELYCPLCTGLRLDNCDLPLCDQMREVIGQKLASGETTQEIKAYFVEQYGETVLGVPPKRGGMILAWVLPFLVLLVAGGGVYYVIRGRTGQRPDETETPAAQELPSEYVKRMEHDLEQLE